MSRLRNKYHLLELDGGHQNRRNQAQKDPSKIKSLLAHLFVLGYLPGSKVATTIVPALQDIASQTERFKLYANRPCCFRHGIAINLTDYDEDVKYHDHAFKLGGRIAHSGFAGIYWPLRLRWGDKGEGWLSRPNQNIRPQFVIMNHANFHARDKAWAQFKEGFKGDSGTAEGLGLWLTPKKGPRQPKMRFDFRPKT